MSGTRWMRLLVAVCGVGGVGLAAGPARMAFAEEQPEGGVTVIRSPNAPQRVAIDAGITNDIKAKLENERTLRHSEVTISTENGVVTLVGVVDSPFARDAAVDLAEKSGGVVRVNDMLRLNIASPNAPSRN
jgi:osmotically-inducible protein OsmY